MITKNLTRRLERLAGAFIFCCVLGLQGCAAQLLPRRWFLRASAFLQLVVFCLLVRGYFLQRIAG
jgi:hypothetical protein